MDSESSAGWKFSPRYPASPQSSRILAEDFGVTPSEIRQAINDLRLKGFINSLDWCGASIPHHHRKRATIAAEEYFEALYGATA